MWNFDVYNFHPHTKIEYTLKCRSSLRIIFKTFLKTFNKRCIYMKGRITGKKEKKRREHEERPRKPFHLLVHSPNNHHGQGAARNQGLHL